MHSNAVNAYKGLIALILISVFSVTVKSQSMSPNSSFLPHWYVGLNGGTSLFFGDVKQYQWWPVTNYENEWRGAFGLNAGRQFSPVFGVRGQAVYGKLAGTRRVWNKHFTNDYWEFNLNTTINLNNIFSRYRSDRFVNTYLIFGLGLLNYNTYVYQLGTNKQIQTVGGGAGKSFGGRTLEGVFHGGIGVDFRITDRLNVNFETANRIMNSDMLDGHISGFKYDVFNYTAVGLSYKFAFAKSKSRSPNQQQTTYKEPDSRNRNGEVETVDYDYGKPVQPPEVSQDVLIISPDIVNRPNKTVKDTVVEIITEPEPDIVIVEETPSIKDFEYRVQIRAKYGNSISLQLLSNQYNLPVGDIKENRHNGYYIYTVGSFATYDEARDYRNRLRTYNGIGDAFVVAFRNGQRLDKLP